MSAERRDNAEKPLTQQEQLFVEGVVAGKSGKQAAIDAGFSERSAHVQASRMLRRANVAAAIAARQTAVVAAAQVETGVTLKRLLEELALIALADPKDFYDSDGKLLPVHLMPEGIRRALASFECDQRHLVEGELLIASATGKLRLWDKQRAIQLIGQLAGLMPKEKVEHEHKGEVVYRWKRDDE